MKGASWHTEPVMLLIPLDVEVSWAEKTTPWLVLKGSEDGESHSELMGFWTFSIVQYSGNWKACFGDWICFRLQVCGGPI